MGRKKSITFVDAVDGSLAALAGGIARALGIDAVAATVSDRAVVPKDVIECLEEVGMKPSSVAKLGAPTNGLVVFLRDARRSADGPPGNVATDEVWAVDVASGSPSMKYADTLPEAFERMATLRRTRDVLERRIAKAFADRI